ncbi:uncharacterized mitochondrial protein AtMg00810-like [Lycium ferocissimum]|uniref:uncharacterized mitochondrial protein AtMg00810-like n=1 Tax=Lycium ferocissimum TaxID=112874 RepID=UPI002815E187|nr:uncharacterized mitochondrial protein AtMg00810-like [Lycium ferocissimum]
MKDLGGIKYFSGIEFSRPRKGIHMCQRKYAVELVSELGLLGGKPVSTPLEFNHKLTSVEFDKLTDDKHENNESHTGDKCAKFDPQLIDRGRYQRIIESLRGCIQSCEVYKGVPRIGSFMPSRTSSELTAFCDVDWGACVETRKSVTGYAIKFGDALILWKSKKQNTVSRSSAEAEFRSMATHIPR